MNLLWIKRRLASWFCDTDRMRRLVIRPGAIGDFIVSLPALECLATETSKSGPPRALFPGAIRRSRARHRVHGPGPAGRHRAPAGLIEDLRAVRLDRSWYGANRPEFRETVAALGLPFTLPPGAASRGRGVTRHRFLPGTGAPIRRMPQRRHSADRLRRASARTIAVIHPFSGSATQELAAGEVPRAGERSWRA